MKAIEIVKICRDILKMLSKSDINVRDWRYVDMYNDYHELKRTGLKIRSVAQELADRYDISVCTVFRTIKKFEKEIDM